MAIKNHVFELAKKIKPEAEINYEFITVNGVNVYTLTWRWVFEGNELNHKLFFSGNENKDLVTVRINAEVDNMKKIEAIVLKAGLLRREE